MVQKVIKGKITTSEYTFNSITKEELLNSDDILINDYKFTMFMLVTCDDRDEIGTVHVIGTTTSQKALINNIDHFMISHILYIQDSGWYQNRTISEELILMFSPKEIWFLDRGTKLVYNEWLSKLNTSS